MTAGATGTKGKGRRKAPETKRRKAPGRSTAAASGRASHRAAPEPSKPRRSEDRFRARRLDLARREGLRRLRLVLGVAAVTTMAVGVIAFVNSSWFDVDQITVTGNEQADAEEIVQASAIDIGQGLLEVDLDRARRSIELVPWVGTAAVTRSWGGSVRIEVTERPPSVAIPAGDRFALVDDHGRQLEVVDRRPDGYLPIRGIEGSGVPGEAAPDEILPIVAVLDALPTEVLDRVAVVAVLAGDLHLELVDGGQANLGDGTDLGAKLQAFETMLARVELTCLDTIDVRVPEAPVVTRTAELPPAGSGKPMAGC